MFLDLSIPQGRKNILRLVGLDVGDARLPLSKTSNELLEQVRHDLQQEGFFEWAFK